ncbi:U3 small nucleolar RNA-interacting protein 2-like [Mytilus galloprovincialis]|uniref:U3 small nucleolar RNA-interacting protein 2-like n=1 Tax=Mytilus edulis TaxID=6550 RepID=UPI0039F09347
MSFFIKNRKRKPEKSQNKKQKFNDSQNKSDARKPKKRFLGEELDSDSDIESDIEGKKTYSSSEEDIETAQEKKLRLAKQYLSQIQAEEADNLEDEEIHRDIVSHRLKQDILEQTGRLHKQVADDYIPPTIEDITVLRGHQLSVTCIIISSDSKHIYSGSKDCTIIKWDTQTCRKVYTVYGAKKNGGEGHSAHVMSLAISSDGKYLASGDANKEIHIRNPETMEKIKVFRGHRNTVSGLAFRKGSHQLFSASHDRAVKIWNLDEMTYVETLYGHEDAITSIDSLTRERAITAGGRDASLRIWKIIEESQLVFHGHMGSIDCVSLINETNFVSGGDDNSIALWGVMKKKPMVLVRNAHSGNSEEKSEFWISAVASLQHTDLIATGSKDGMIRFWKCGDDFKSLKPIFSLPVTGFVNSLQFSKDGSFLVAGVGQEHKMGRWWRIKEARNSICIIKLSKANEP